jgi:hypothetical protein
MFDATFNSISVILLWSVLLMDETSENHRPVPRRFEDTKGTIRIRISKKNRQHNGRKKKYKGTNNDLVIILKNYITKVIVTLVKNHSLFYVFLIYIHVKIKKTITKDITLWVQVRNLIEYLF